MFCVDEPHGTGVSGPQGAGLVSIRLVFHTANRGGGCHFAVRHLRLRLEDDQQFHKRGEVGVGTETPESCAAGVCIDGKHLEGRESASFQTFLTSC